MGTPPSNLVRITDPVKAYYFDRGIWLFCSKIESEMDQAANNAKNPKFAKAARTRVLNKYLKPAGPQKFKDPVASAEPQDTPESTANDVTVDLGGDFFG